MKMLANPQAGANSIVLVTGGSAQGSTRFMTVWRWTGAEVLDETFGPDIFGKNATPDGYITIGGSGGGEED